MKSTHLIGVSVVAAMVLLGSPVQADLVGAGEVLSLQSDNTQSPPNATADEGSTGAGRSAYMEGGRNQKESDRRTSSTGDAFKTTDGTGDALGGGSTFTDGTRDLPDANSPWRATRRQGSRKLGGPNRLGDELRDTPFGPRDPSVDIFQPDIGGVNKDTGSAQGGTPVPAPGAAALALIGLAALGVGRMAKRKA